MSAIFTPEQARKAYDESRAEAATLKAAADKLRTEMLSAGVNLLEGGEPFDRVDAAYKAADEAHDRAQELRFRIDRAAAWDTGGRKSDGAPSQVYREGIQDRAARRRLGHMFTSSDGYADLQKRMRGAEAEMSKLAIASQGLANGVPVMSRDEFGDMLAALGDFYATTVTGNSATSAGPFIQNDLMAGFVAYQRKRPSLAAIVGAGETDSDVVEYVSQSAGTQSAAETAEDTAATESVYAFATNTVNVREITHFVPVTLRAMEDAGQIRTIVENQLVIGVLDRLDTQIASGGGTGQDFAGIYNTSGIGTQALGGDSRLDCLHKAITQIRVAAGVLAEPDYIGLHPNDWQKIRLGTDANGQYLLGPAGMAGDRMVWGVPAIVSTVFTAGTPIVGDFGGSATLWRRNALTVNTGLDGNDFTKRRVSILAAIRAAFVVTRALGFCTPTGF